MKIFRLNFIKQKIALLWLICLCLLASSAKGAETEPGLVIKQNSSVIGATELRITKDHAKLVIRATNLTFLVDEKNILVFSKSTKAFYVSTIDAYPGPPVQKLMTLSGLGLKDYRLIKGKSSSILGQPTSDYAVQRTFKKSSPDIFTNKFQRFSAFTKTGVNPRIAMAICRIYGLPMHSELPAELVYEQFGSMVKGCQPIIFKRQLSSNPNSKCLMA